MLTVIAAGQSLATGGGWRDLPRGQGVLSTTPPDPERLLMLNTGTITSTLEPLDPAAFTELVPVCEKIGFGESQGTAMLRMLGADGVGVRRDWLYLNHAVAGQPIDALVGEATPQKNGLALVAAAVRLAAARGQALRIVAATWSHGEADRSKAKRWARQHPDRDLRGYYRDALIGHASNSTADYRRLTGQTEPIWTMVDQLAAPTTGVGPSEIALAMADAAEAGERIALVCPRYHFRPPFGYVGAVHLEAAGYALLGEYHAKAIGLLLDAETRSPEPRRTDFEPCLRPDLGAIRRSSRTIRVPLRGARGPLAIDRDSLPPARDFGFGWRPAAGDGAITAVELDGDVVILTLARESPGRLTYAMTVEDNRPAGQSSAWGNIRDSDPATSLTVPGLRLYNWLTVFDAEIA